MLGCGLNETLGMEKIRYHSTCTALVGEWGQWNTWPAHHLFRHRASSRSWWHFWWAGV